MEPTFTIVGLLIDWKRWPPYRRDKPWIDKEKKRNETIAVRGLREHRGVRGMFIVYTLRQPLKSQMHFTIRIRCFDPTRRVSAYISLDSAWHNDLLLAHSFVGLLLLCFGWAAAHALHCAWVNSFSIRAFSTENIAPIFRFVFISVVLFVPHHFIPIRGL